MADTKPWGEAEKQAWFEQQTIQRSYEEDVVTRIEALEPQFEITRHGALSIDPDRYPLFSLRSRTWSAESPTVLITGGVHGYETSGVHGALRFLEEEAPGYSDHFNIFSVPCVSPWGYETINRWNPVAMDPNRSFYPDTPCEESAALMSTVATLEGPLLMHIDLHETTDTDNTVFRPALAARDGIKQDNWDIPDGFYLVGTVDRPVDDFQAAIIEAVRRVTHIAPADAEGCIIGEQTTQAGVINYDASGLFLCTGFSNAAYCTTTEVYPDSPRTSPAECTLAQVVAVKAGLDFLLGGEA